MKFRFSWIVIVVVIAFVVHKLTIPSVFRGLPSNDNAISKEYRNLGHYAVLPEGRTHYVIHKPKTKPAKGRIVLVHGMYTPGIYFYGWTKEFANAGYEVLTYDNWGRGMSDYPSHLRLNAATYSIQLAQLLASVGWLEGKPPMVIGTSLGGPIAVEYAYHFPIAALGLVAPTGLMSKDVEEEHMVLLKHFSQVPLSWVTPYIKGWLVPHLIDKMMRDTAGDDWKQDGGVLLGQLERSEGYIPATSSIITNFNFYESAKSYAEAAKVGDITVVWGEKDTTVKFSCSKRVLHLMPHAHLVSLPQCDHNVMKKGCDFVSPLMELADKVFQE